MNTNIVQKYIPYSISSDVFDESGSYGADQKGPSLVKCNTKEYVELFKIAKKYNDTLTPLEFPVFLERLNSEGCGYAAIVNIIFMAYHNMDELFEEDFGFPRRDERNALNFNKMLVDLYAATDNHSLKDGIDFYDAYEDRQRNDKIKNYNIDDDIGTKVYKD